MVGHQNIGMNGTFRTFCIFLQPAEIKQIIVVGEETGLPIIPSLNDMEWNIGHY